MTKGPDELVAPLVAIQRKRIIHRLIGLATVAAVLLGGAVWVTVDMLTCGPLGSSVVSIDGECVGVTDGSYHFKPHTTNEDVAKEIEHVQELIEQENKRVREFTPDSYATVALLDPLTPDDNSSLPPDQVRNRLEGAYTALRRANVPDSHADPPRPQIQLVLANEGETDDQSQYVRDQLKEMSDQEEHPLLAVIGLGVSTAATKKRADVLSTHHIPMVSSYLTADGLADPHSDQNRLFRVSPTNHQFAQALLDYVLNKKNKEKNKSKRRTGVLVYDSNSGDDDLFTRTLKKAFNDTFPNFIQPPPMIYKGDPGERHFDDVVEKICNRHAKMVFYAGREVDIGAFLHELSEDSSCVGKDKERQLTLLTGGLDLGEILQSQKTTLEHTGLSVVVAGTVDTEGWKKDAQDGQLEPGTPSGYQTFFGAFTKSNKLDPKLAEAVHLKGANAIMMHDALLTAAYAVHHASRNGHLTRNTVRNILQDLSPQRIPGASGTFTFNNGVLVGKPVPVLEYSYSDKSDGAPNQVGNLCFTSATKSVECPVPKDD